MNDQPSNQQGILAQLLAGTPARGGILGAKPPSPPMSGLLGYQVRNELYPGETSYFQSNPNVAGMASDSGHVVLNPFSPPGVKHESVARNEALRLHMKDRGIVPSFEVTPEQQQAFQGTPYGSNLDALKQTIAARIYSGDPSSKATEQQRNWLEVLMGGAER